MQTSFLGTAWSRKFVPIVAVHKTTYTVHCKDKFVVENKNFGMTFEINKKLLFPFIFRGNVSLLPTKYL
jgi:hypothetical protein